jgi:hypothetical protein
MKFQKGGGFEDVAETNLHREIRWTLWPPRMDTGEITRISELYAFVPQKVIRDCYFDNVSISIVTIPLPPWEPS